MLLNKSAWNRLASCLGLLAVLGFCGCGASTASVGGAVTLDGEPIEYGMVSLQNSDGTVVSGAIQKGRYQLPEVPLGEAKLLVQTFAPPVDTVMVNPADPEAVAAAKNGSSTPPGKALAIPPRYREYDKSGLTLEVKPGNQTKDLELTQ